MQSHVDAELAGRSLQPLLVQLTTPPPPQERVMHEEHLRQVEAQLDYLAPFLAQLPPGEKLTRWQAVRLKDECLNDFKQRLIDKANLIQARFEKVRPGPGQGRGPQCPHPENRPRTVCLPSHRLVRE